MRLESTAAKLAPSPAAPPIGTEVEAKRSWFGPLLAGQIPLDSAVFRALAFLTIIAQCAILYWVINRFKIETDLFRLMMAVALTGFVVHHLLPLRWRLPFFVTLSMGLVAYCLGLERAQWSAWNSLKHGGMLFAIGLGMIGICRLPLRFGYRVGLLVACGGALALVRAQWIHFGAMDAIWPILGAMFMYRLAVYIYDLEHENKRSSLLQGCSYFFLFPNVWLFVFPIIDFKTFLKTYYDEPAHRIYQRGIEWMMRGVIQLLLWRLIYYQVYIDPARISNGAELVQFLVANIALYLRVSGQFHFAIGLLHLFGFNLPEANRKYFLASSFVDYWRRANIYMKDFLMKICYYPLVVRFKKLGTVWSVVAAISCTFVVTWFLHPYQWFWIRGSFATDPKDIVFWSLLGLAVVLNSVRDLTASARKTETGGKWGTALRQALSTAGTFTVVTLLWSIWTCDSLTQWVGIWRLADWDTLIYGGAAVAVIMLAKIVLESPAGLAKPKPRLGARHLQNVMHWRPVAYAVALPAFLLILGSSDRVMGKLPVEAKAVARSLFSNTPNKSGEEFLVRGYYEGLMDIGRVSPLLEGALTRQPANWQLLEQTPVVRVTPDLRTRDLVPSLELAINGVAFQTNKSGIRDSEYALEKAPGVTRIAVMGSSITMGWNVAKDETFEAILERDLNARSGGPRYEAWNFAVNGYSIVSLVEQLDRKVIASRPDVVMVVSHPEDPGRAVFMLAKSIAMGADPEYPFLRELIAKENLNAKTPRNWSERKLGPYAKELTKWSYQTIAARCKAQGIKPVLVYLPGVLQQSTTGLDREMTGYAEAAGFQVIPLFDVYADVADRSTLMVAAWDAHPNAAGHKRIAANLLRRLDQTRILAPSAHR